MNCTITYNSAKISTAKFAGSGARAALVRLRVCGFCRLDPSAHTRARAVHRVYCTLVLAITVTYLVQEALYALNEQRDMDKLARVMFLLLCHVTSIAKQIVFYVDSERIEVLVAQLDDPLMNQRERLLWVAARDATRSGRGYSGTAAFTCLLWTVFPVMSKAQGLDVEFPIWTGPLHYNANSLAFALTLIYSYYVTTLVGVANTTMDVFLGTLLHQAKMQLRILRLNYESLAARARSLSRRGRTGEGHDAVLKRLFVECLMHYKKINNMLALLQDIFGRAILAQFTISGWILCMAAYKIIGVNVLSIEFVSMLLFILCILAELFIYCYFGNEVTVESSELMESVYAAEWVGAGAWFRSRLMLVLERAKRPLRPRACGVVPLSLETFVKILKSSYSFYAVLRQTKNNNY